jgi:hypothetical protein
MILKQYIELCGEEQNHHQDPKKSSSAKVEDEIDVYPLHS